MIKLCLPVTLLVFLTACHPTAENKAASAFMVSDLQPGDGSDLTGCITRVARAGRTDGSRVFIEDSLQGGANGYIRIDGQLFAVKMVHGGADQMHAVRSFTDEKKLLSVVESYDIAEAKPGQTVRPLTGELIVTWRDVTQRIPIGGARECIEAP